MESLFDAIARHQADARKASIFGVILYTRAHPFIRKVLEDPDLLDALDVLSGPQWVFFYSHMSTGEEKVVERSHHFGYVDHSNSPFVDPRRDRQQQVQEQQQQMPRFSDETLEATCTAFEIDPDRGLPCLLLLFMSGEGDVAFYSTTTLLGADKANAYASLVGAVRDVATALVDIDPANYKNASGLHAAVELKHQNRSSMAWLSRLLKITPLLKGATGMAADGI